MNNFEPLSTTQVQAELLATYKRQAEGAALIIHHLNELLTVRATHIQTLEGDRAELQANYRDLVERCAALEKEVEADNKLIKVYKTSLDAARAGHQRAQQEAAELRVELEKFQTVQFNPVDHLSTNTPLKHGSGDPSHAPA